MQKEKNSEPQDIKYEKASLKDLKFHSENPVKHNKLNKSVVRSSVEEFGPYRGIAIDENLQILAGNNTVEQLMEAGYDNVLIIEPEEGTLVAIKRSDLSEDDKARYAVADNASAKTAVFDDDVILQLRDKGLKLNNFLSEKYLNELGKDKPTPIEEIKTNYPESEHKYYVIVECDDEDTQMGVYEMLQDEGHQVMKYSGDRQKQNRGNY